MAESQTVVILRNKRDDIALAITSYERELERARADFAHITAALAIFDAAILIRSMPGPGQQLLWELAN